MALQIRLDPSAPLYLQVVEGIAGAVARGELTSGTPLPSVRELSEALGINPNTVQKAYRELQREGLVQARPGSGVFVHPDEERLAAVRERLVAAIVDQALAALAGYGIDAEAAIERIRALQGAVAHGGRD